MKEVNDSYEKWKREFVKEYGEIGLECLKFRHTLESHNFTVEEAEELFMYISKLLAFTEDKKAPVRALKREGRLKQYWRSNKGKKYSSKRRRIVEKLISYSRIYYDEENKEHQVLSKSIFDIVIGNCSETTKWRIKKDLEQEGIEIISSDEYTKKSMQGLFL